MMPTIKVILSLVEFKEKNQYIIYSPALDLSGYGTTAKEAKKSFAEVLAYFLEYAMENQTLSQDLKRLGWKITDKQITPPSLKNIILHNQNFVDIFENHNLKKISQKIEIPLLAA